MKKIIAISVLFCMLFSFAAYAQENDCVIVDIVLDKENPKAGDRVMVEVETEGPALVQIEGEGVHFVETNKKIDKAGKLYFAAVILDENFEISARANDGVSMIYESGDFE